MKVFYFKVILLTFENYNQKKIKLGILHICAWQPALLLVLFSFHNRLSDILSMCFCQGLSIFLQHNLLLSYCWLSLVRVEIWFAMDNSQDYLRVTHRRWPVRLSYPCSHNGSIFCHSFCVKWVTKIIKGGKRNSYSKWSFAVVRPLTGVPDTAQLSHLGSKPSNWLKQSMFQRVNSSYSDECIV